MKTKINRENIIEHLIEYQLNMIDKTIDEIKTDVNWYGNNTLTKEQHEEFRKYAISVMQKVFKFNKNKAITNFNWFNLGYGLKVIENELD